MTDEKKKDKKDGKEAKKVDDEQLKDVAGGATITYAFVSDLNGDGDLSRDDSGDSRRENRAPASR
jgi:hypothetical protein